MGWIEEVAKRTGKTGSCACLGLDPLLEKIPMQEKSIEKKIVFFFESILNALKDQEALPSVVKPNYAFFGQYGFEGLRALQNTIDFSHSLGLPVLLDAKRSDIGKTAEAYAKECFDFWKCDAVTVNPFLGTDSVEPFLEYAKKGKGIILLNRTSNSGASDFQTQKLANGKFVFETVSEKIVQWNEACGGNAGAVVGATSISELESISCFFASQKNPPLLLIPGVGAQGGSALEVMAALRKNHYPLARVLINSSSAVLYAHEKNPGVSFEQAAVNALKELVEQTRI